MTGASSGQPAEQAAGQPIGEPAGQPMGHGSAEPAGREATTSRRGLIIAVVILLIAVIGLAVALVLTLNDRDSAPNAGPTPTVAAQPTDDPAGETASAEPSAGTAEQTPEGPLQYPDSIEPLAAEQHRDADDPYAFGDVDADIVIVEYADYRCGYCALWATTVKPALAEHIADGRVRLEFRDMPVLGEESVTAAIAARAAGEQGKFAEYQDALFSRTAEAATTGGGHPSFDEDSLVEVATEVGVADLAAFREALGSEEIRSDVLALREHNAALGISGTPFFIIYDGFLSGFLPAEQFVPLVEDQVSKAQADGKAGMAL
ncbi:MAG: thioredoxin domain-containing protein [Flaviflexus sp.]|nr:thioredoxin domain-containing protein [Flaviflexus sp.]